MIQDAAYLWQLREQAPASTFDGDQISLITGACLLAVVIALSLCRHNALDREEVDNRITGSHLLFALREYPGGVSALANEMGVDPSYIYRMAKGARKITSVQAEALAKSFAAIYRSDQPKDGWWLESQFGLRLSRMTDVTRAFRAASR